MSFHSSINGSVFFRILFFLEVKNNSVTSAHTRTVHDLVLPTYVHVHVCMYMYTYMYMYMYTYMYMYIYTYKDIYFFNNSCKYSGVSVYSDGATHHYCTLQ